MESSGVESSGVESSGVESSGVEGEGAVGQQRPHSHTKTVTTALHPGSMEGRQLERFFLKSSNYLWDIYLFEICTMAKYVYGLLSFIEHSEIVGCTECTLCIA